MTSPVFPTGAPIIDSIGRGSIAAASATILYRYPRPHLQKPPFLLQINFGGQRSKDGMLVFYWYREIKSGAISILAVEIKSTVMGFDQ